MTQGNSSSSPERTRGNSSVGGAPENLDGQPSWPRLVRLFRYAWPYRWRLFTALVCLAIGSGLGLLYPRFFGEVIDAAFTSKDLDALNVQTLTLFGIFALNSVFVFFRHYLISWVGERVVADVRVELYGHLLRLSPAFFHRKRTGELLSRLADDVSKVHSTVSSDLSVGARNTLTLIGGVIILFWTNPQLAAVMLATVPPLALATVYFGRMIRKLARRAQDELARANAAVQEGLGGIETVQSFTREPFELQRYQQSISQTFGLFLQRIKAGSWFMSLSSFVAFGAITGIFWLGGRMVATDSITAGDLTEFMLYTMLISGAIGSMAGTWTSFQAALGATARIFEILDTRPEIEDGPNARPLSSVRGDVRFEQVAFSYGDRSSPVLAGIDLSIEAGQSVALVGQSGAGKTTLTRLLLRLYEPDAGRVLVDGIDIRTVRLEDLRGSIGMVSQEPLLFGGSIRDNIRYGRLDATDAEVERAALLAHADVFIREFPDGFETQVGERGVQLSGGQRQRISIARAVLRDPPILILDEATSALDAHSESLVQDALEHLQKGRTTLVIAHRLSTVRNADRIIVMDGGRIVEQGRHEELMAAEGTYARLVMRQLAGAEGSRSGLEPVPHFEPASGAGQRRVPALVP